MGSTLAPPTEADLEPAPPQFMQALAEANRVRLARAAFKRRLAAQPDRASSARLCVELLGDTPDVLHGMTIVELLTACRRVGTMQGLKVLEVARVPERREIGRLTPAQRQRLIGALGMMG